MAGSSFPSGNGTAGGTFSYLLNVLTGDATGDGVVNALDVADVKKRLTRRPGDGVTGSSAYTIYADVNGDAAINALDIAALKQRLNRRLPTTIPAVAAVASAGAVASPTALELPSATKELFALGPTIA